MNRNQSTGWTAAGCLLLSLPAACSGGDASDASGGEGGDAGAATASGGTKQLGSGGRSASGGSAVTTGTGGSREGSLALCTVEGQLSVGNPKGSLLIDDFDDGDAGLSQNGLMGGWYAYDDESGGEQIPTGSVIAPTAGGLTEQGYALRVQGSGFDFWGSGFGTNFTALREGLECVFDASAYSGISFWTRGFIKPKGEVPSGEEGRMRVQIIEKDVAPLSDGGNCDTSRGPCWDSHRVRIAPSDCWTKHSLRFDEFVADGWGVSGGPLDLNEFYLLGFEVSEGQDYDIWLDRIEFFIGEPALEQPVCNGGNNLGGQGPGGAAGAP